jgi:hypothetical protein
MSDERWFANVAASADVDEQRSPAAPARLKSRIFSALVRQLTERGSLLTLAESKSCGGGLCVFEEAVVLLGNERLGSMNPCNVCHARVLGERLEHAPIFWPNCPYSDFHKRSRD